MCLSSFCFIGLIVVFFFVWKFFLEFFRFGGVVESFQ